MKLGYSYPNRTKVFFDIMIIFYFFCTCQLQAGLRGQVNDPAKNGVTRYGTSFVPLVFCFAFLKLAPKNRMIDISCVLTSTV